ncbi:MAG: PAS domain S-box protein [Proteobacteria bacterium]|nr:PAS domain S-box protein [Pseudomonadota bacterium]
MSRLDRVRAALSAPTFPELSQTLRALYVHYVALTLMAIVLVWQPVAILFTEPTAVEWALNAGTFAACVACLALVRRGHVAVAGSTLLGTVWVGHAVLVTVQPNIVGADFGGFLGLVVAAGLLVGSRAAFVVAAASAGLGILIGNWAGDAALTQTNGVATMAGWALYFAGTAGLVGIANYCVRLVLQRLNTSQERFRAVTEGSRDLVAELDQDGRIVYASPNHEPVMGYRPVDLSGRRAFDLVHPEDQQRLLDRFARGEEANQRLFRFRHAGGSWRWIETNSHTFQTAEGAPRTITVSRDVTERRQLEERLHQSQRLESVGRLAGGMAHDFNNLLTVIRGYVEMLRNESDRDELREVAEASESGTELIRQLLAFSRQQPVRPRVVDVGDIVRGLEGMLQRLIGETTAIQLDLTPEPTCVKSDPFQIEQVLVNLVVNARDALPNGGEILVSTRNRGPEGESGDSVLLEVRDNGEGMDEETVTQIFDPFFTTKAEGMGTGLGLSTVHGIVTQNDGSIEVETKRGEGTVFRIRLPRTHETVRAPTQAAKSATTPAADEVTVLVVEDNAAVRRFVRRSLEEGGYRVLEAVDGSEALQLAMQRGRVIDLLLTDLVMPGMTGAELHERLQAAYPKMGTLFMSGYLKGDDRALQALPTRHPMLSKPFTGDELLLELQRIRSRRELRSRR